MQRRDRTRRLIELGGLVQKSGVADLLLDDRAALYGALLQLAAELSGPDGPHLAALWRRGGKRAFDAEDAARTAQASRSDTAQTP